MVPLIIAADDGGYLWEYAIRAEAAIKSGRQVKILGRCGSACTFYLASPNVCVGPDAELWFHQASYDFDETKPAPDGTAQMLAAYPERLKRWIARHGGLTRRILKLRGVALRRMFAPC